MKEGMLNRSVMKAWKTPMTVPTSSATAMPMKGAAELAPSAEMSPIRSLLIVAQMMAVKE